jgi:hypothetical protein
MTPWLQQVWQVTKVENVRFVTWIEDLVVLIKCLKNYHLYNANGNSD